VGKIGTTAQGGWGGTLAKVWCVWLGKKKGEPPPREEVSLFGGIRLRKSGSFYMIPPHSPGKWPRLGKENRRRGITDNNQSIPSTIWKPNRTVLLLMTKAKEPTCYKQNEKVSETKTKEKGKSSSCIQRREKTRGTEKT